MNRLKCLAICPVQCWAAAEIALAEEEIAAGQEALGVAGFMAAALEADRSVAADMADQSKQLPGASAESVGTYQAAKLEEVKRQWEDWIDRQKVRAETADKVAATAIATCSGLATAEEGRPICTGQAPEHLKRWLG